MNLLEKEAWINVVSNEYEEASPQQVIRLAFEQFPKLTLACSFGAEDVVLMDMLYRIKKDANVFYLDTDFHFRETYETRDRLLKRYPELQITRVKPRLTPEEHAEQYGDLLWEKDPNQCCSIRKVPPLTEVLQHYDAWITGIRRDQAPTRANAKKVEYDVKFGLVKFNPLANWKSEDVWSYIRDHDVIYNPLHDNHYPSIGCHYCTRQVQPGEDPRAGRWAGNEKIECGLHK